MKGRLLYTLSTSDEVYEHIDSIYVKFNGQRNTLSTSPLNGGYREDLNYVFNQDGKNKSTGIYTLKAPDYFNHLKTVSSKLGLNPIFTTGISTAASMRNVSIVEKAYKGLKVTALTTGSTKNNGGRVGDPSAFDERSLKFNEKEHSTINIILVIDANLPPGTITRALITCTEAKTAALQELLIGSKYSYGLATGTGTDACVIIGNLESPVNLTFAGKHSKLGELIGLSVKESVKEALSKESNINPTTQFSLLKRLKRYDITKESLWKEYRYSDGYSNFTKTEFYKELSKLDRNRVIVIYSSLIFHIVDQYRWNLIEKKDILDTVPYLFSKLFDDPNIENSFENVDFERANILRVIVKKYKELIVTIIGIYLASSKQ